MDLEKIMYEALIEFKDSRVTPRQDQFIDRVLSRFSGEVDENIQEDVIQFYQLHFE